MKFNKTIITGDLAHFKNARGGKNQSTHDIPPVSTVIGILKNIYGQDIADFKFGYTFESDEKCKQIEHIHKEVNINQQGNSLTTKERYAMYPSVIEYHVNPKLTIYHTIDLAPNIESPLNLGRQCCMAKATFEEIEIHHNVSTQTNVLTDIADGVGVIYRGNVETVYDDKKGYFDYYTRNLRINLVEVDVDYEDEDGNGIYLWRYIEKGCIECYKEKL